MEPRAKRFILRGNANRAGIQMALPRHHASDCQQRRCAEAEFVGAQNCRENNVPGEFQASVHTEREPRTEAGANQRVMGLAQPDFPRKPGILDRSERRRTRAAVVPAYGNDVGAGFCDPGGNDAHAGSGNQFHADARLRVHGAQIVNQLRQIFDAVNVVMRWRRNQRRSGRRMPDARNVLTDFLSRQLPALARLRSLRHFDFEFLGVHQVIGGDAEPRRSHLFDLVGRGRFIPVCIRIFPAFAGIAARPKLVHRQRERAMRFRTQ